MLARHWVGGIAASALLMPTAAMAATPRDVSDLVGARAAGGETQLEQRGYVHIKTDKSDDRAWSYWWHSGRKQCLSVATVDGRYDSITDTPAADCNQRGGKSDGSAVAAGVAVAALIGAIALAHKSHNHDDGKHYDDDKTDAVYERGFRDGLYNQSYHNYDRADAYSRGYEAGTRQREDETSYRHGHRSGAGGYTRSVNVSDLQGARASSADGELQSRGFRNVDALKSGNAAYTIWYNRDTRQCLQMAIADGRVDSLVDIGSSPNCR